MIPTLAAGEPLEACLESLGRQTFREFETTVVDNSGQSRAQAAGTARILRNAHNVGFGAAVNQAARGVDSEFIAVINDDARAEAGWLEALVRCADRYPEAGMFASHIRLTPGRLDSAGMLLCGDGSSKQRGHGLPPGGFLEAGEALLPSGCAAMYRRKAFDEAGGFDPDFFLYCEDTDLGLQLRWAGWTCRYVPEAVVDHLYSRSAGRASPLKAYLVERNRLRTVAANFPSAMLCAVPFVTMWRYVWHLAAALSGRGRAGEFREQGGSAAQLAWYAVKAHLALAAVLPAMLQKRRSVIRRISAREFAASARQFRISAREVASQ